MTTKETDSATSDAKPKEGEVLLYIDWQNRRIYGKNTTPEGEKKGSNRK